MRITNKMLYAFLADISCELEVLRDELEDINAKLEKPIVKDLDKPKKKKK